MEPWKRNLAAVWVSNFVTLAGVSCVLPFLPLILAERGVTGATELRLWSGLVYGAAFLSAAVMGPVWGLLGDRFGRRLMVLRSLAAIAVFMTLQAFFHDPWSLLVLRLLHGAFSGFVAPALTLVSTGAPADRQGSVVAVLQTSLVSGGVAGPLLGGLVGDRFGHQVAFVASGALAAVAFLVVLAAAREIPGTRGTPAEGVPRLSPASIAESLAAEVRGLLSSGPLLRIVLLVFLIQFGITLTEPLLALYVRELVPGAANVALLTGIAFAASPLANLMLAPWWGRRSDRRGYRATLVTTLVGASCVYFPQALVSGHTQLVVLRMALGCFAAGILPSVYALVGSQTPLARRGACFGLTLSAFQLASVVGPIAGGLAAAAFGLSSVFFLTSATLLVAAGLGARLLPAAPPEGVPARAGGADGAR